VHLAVGLYVMLGGFLGVFGRMGVVALRQVSVMGGCFVVALFMMLGGFVVMARSVLVMLRCLLVMLGCFVGHGELLSSRRRTLRHARIIGTRAYGTGYSPANAR
jgi:hypothetical protein